MTLENVCVSNAEVDLEMKAKALATCEIREVVSPKHWKKDVALMQFL
jgi:integrase/recombinase XerD